jgi:hypothetical protein
MPEVDYVEVGRKAHELDRAHGGNAYLYAARLAEEAHAEGEAEEYAFWKAVEANLKPRTP